MYFLYLGHYYRKFEDMDKSRRCYEKTFTLNPKCIDAAAELSKIYRLLKKWVRLNLLGISCPLPLKNKKNIGIISKSLKFIVFIKIKYLSIASPFFFQNYYLALHIFFYICKI